MNPDDRSYIGECKPQGETVAECKARLSRVVEKQKQCYATKNVPIPTWLDADFLYRINYGPGTREDAVKAWEILYLINHGPEPREDAVPALKPVRPSVLRKRDRVRLTLLDRHVVNKLYRAVFKKGQPPVLYSDWDTTKDPPTAFPNAQSISPFDYVAHTVDTLIYRWCEEFVVQTVWKSDYSSKIFGAQRPPMAAVAFDLILLVKHLSQLPRYPEQPLSRCFRTFLRRRTLHSLSIGPGFDFDWACRGYLWDLYNILVHYKLTQNGLDKYGKTPPDDEAEYINVTWVEQAKFPGGDTLGIECAVDHEQVKKIFGSLADMRASFINSGPFELALTTNLSDHLTMKNRKILLYCDKPSRLRRDRGHIPGAGYYGPYTKQTLGRYAMSLCS